MLNTILIILALGIGALLLYAALRSNIFRIARSTIIDAAPETIFAILNDLRRGAEWSPFERQDPNLKPVFTGPATGTGATMEWSGSKQIGAGRFSIVESVAPTHLVAALDMYRPMKASNQVTYTLEPVSARRTRLTWAMEGQMNFVARLFGTVCNSEKMVGKEFDKGLADLKRIAEQETATAA